MTALKPIPNRRVVGVQTGIYTANKTCAHPDCADDVPDRGHHIFPRSSIGNGHYFVQAYDDNGKEMFPNPIPHVVGLCRQHHDEVENHSAWIKLNDDGNFIWWDRVEGPDSWVRLGPLDPQPGGRQKTRRPRRKFRGEARRNRTTISFKVPQDEAEDGAGIYEDLLEQMRVVTGEPDKPAYYLIVLALYEFVSGHKDG